MELSERFPEGAFVRYIPMHAHGDPAHSACEDGVVAYCNEVYVFVRYGGRQHATATDPAKLVML